MNTEPETHEVCIATPLGAHRLFGPATEAACTKFWGDIHGRYEARTFIRPIAGHGA